VNVFKKREELGPEFLVFIVNERQGWCE